VGDVSELCHKCAIDVWKRLSILHMFSLYSFHDCDRNIFVAQTSRSKVWNRII